MKRSHGFNNLSPCLCFHWKVLNETGIWHEQGKLSKTAWNHMVL